MRRSTFVANSVVWMTGLFRPWLVAMIGGSILGIGLLNIATPTENLGSYPEFGPRAAVYDPATTESAQPGANGVRGSLATDSSPGDRPGVFDAASPITATEEIGAPKLITAP